MFLLEKTEEITPALIGKILNEFITGDCKKISNYYNYYLGKQDILRKKYVDPCKPCNKIVTNYCSDITNTYLGYLLGKSITYSSNENIDNILEVMNYNDINTEDTELLKWALITGVGYEIHYIDEDGKQRFRVLDSRECIPIFDADLNQELRALIRFYKVDQPGTVNDKYYIELYQADTVQKYISSVTFSSLNLIEEVPNYYHMVPAVVFYLNEEHTSIFDRVMGLNDAYNTLVSSSVDDFEAFCDAYMVLENMDVDEEVIGTMKENRVLVIPSGGKASYLTKNVTEQQVMELLELINKNIHKIAMCPDFSDEAFGTQSGIALKIKLLGMENNAKSIENVMRKALQKRIELLCAILSLSEGDNVWRDINIVFSRNMPEDETALVTELLQLRGLVSDETLLSRIPWIDDVDEELNKIEEQKSKSDIYKNFEVINEGMGD